MILFSFLGCDNNQDNNAPNEWAGSMWEQLEKENIQLRIPKQFKRSSRYRIEEDMKTISKDSTQLSIVQNSLKLLEFVDAHINVFVDTTKSYRMLIICNTSRLDFTKADAAILKKHLEENNKTNALNDSNLEFEELTAKLKGNNNHKLARYTTQIRNKIDNSKINNSIYYLTGKSYTLVVYEFNEDEDSIEKYLWTTKT